MTHWLRSAQGVEDRANALMKLHDEIADLKATFDADKTLSEQTPFFYSAYIYKYINIYMYIYINIYTHLLMDVLGKNCNLFNPGLPRN